MKLTAKLVFIFVIGAVLLLFIDGYLTVRREISLFHREMEHDARVLGRVTGKLMIEISERGGESRALELLDDAFSETDTVNVRWVWLDPDADDRHRPRVPRAKLSAVLQDRQVSFETTSPRGDERLYTYVPLRVNPGRPGALEISESLTPLRAYTTATVHRMLVLTMVMVLISSMSAVVVGVRTVGHPLHALTEKARRIGSGDLTDPLPVRGDDELAELAVAMNGMCESLLAARQNLEAETNEKLQAIEQLRHADRLKTVGKLASGIAHELGTPLNVVTGRAALIASGRISAVDAVESAKIIQSQGQRMTKIIRQLLDFARRRSPQKAPVDFRQLICRTSEMLEPLARKTNSTISMPVNTESIIIKIDAAQIEQVMTNLIVNALQAMPDGGRVDIDFELTRARSIEFRGGQEVACIRLDVRDSGVGISHEDLPRLFEPFFTTKDVGVGTGMGLSIAYGIVREHGGWIDVQSEPGKGTRFSVYLPLEGEGWTPAS